MDGNKDDALKCLKIGKAALDSGDRARALKFLTKAQRLDPSLPMADLLASIPGKESETPSPSSPSSSTTTETTTRVRVSSKKPSKEYTDEQLKVVEHVKKQKDYYKILGMERNCSVEDVRRAYRRLSLKVHPDKNKAPGAEEAFKLVSKAFQCLGNEETKKKYDVLGSEGYDGRGDMKQPHSNGFYENEFELDPDEIFRNFFGGGGGFGFRQATTPFGTFQFRTGGMGAQNGNGGGSFRPWIHLLPFILLILVNFWPSDDPEVYMLSRNSPYEYKVVTQKGVPYFVRSSVKFEKEYPYGSSERRVLERRVEREYVGFLSQNCRVELQRTQLGLANKVPHCDMLEKFKGATA